MKSLSVASSLWSNRRLALSMLTIGSFGFFSDPTAHVLVQAFSSISVHNRNLHQHATAVVDQRYRFGATPKMQASVAPVDSSATSIAGNEQRTVSFQKYHGLGNDFILIDDRDKAEPSLTPEESVKLCDRNFGVGGDGVIFALQPKEDGGNYDLAMRIYNSDGSEPEMCGNGIRCLAKFVYELDVAAGKVDASVTSATSYNIHTLAGPIIPVLNADGTITVDMGEPILEASKVPTTLAPNADGNSVVEQTVVAPNNPKKEWKISAVSMGNPHAIIFVDDLATDVDLATDGPGLESASSLFPAKTNVEFVQVMAPNHLKMQVWERGAGPTLACGTGACALTVAAVRAGKIPPTPEGEPCRVTLPGGDLFIEWNMKTNKIFMSGPATLAFTGVAPV